MEAVALPSQYAASQGQVEVTFVTLPVPVKPRPIRLVCNGGPVSLTPSSQSLSGQLSEETARAWSELKTQYIAEYSVLAALATVTSVSVGLSAVDQHVVDDALRDAESLLDNVDDLEGEEIPTTEDILNMFHRQIRFGQRRVPRRGFPGWRVKGRLSLGPSLKQPLC